MIVGGPRVMFDSVDPAAFPDPGEVSFDVTAGYVDGRWPSSAGIKARFPDLPHLSIAVFSKNDADCLDIEPGNAIPEQAPAWLDRQYARGMARPVIYCGNSSIVAVRSAVGARPFWWWSANWSRVPHIDPGADATQWNDRGPNGENVDQTSMSEELYTYLQGDRMALTQPELDAIGKAAADAIYARRFPKQGSADTTSLGDLVVWSEPVAIREASRVVNSLPKALSDADIARIAAAIAPTVADLLASRLKD
jgi:hypothetical protein